MAREILGDHRFREGRRRKRKNIQRMRKTGLKERKRKEGVKKGRNPPISGRFHIFPIAVIRCHHRGGC